MLGGAAGRRGAGWRIILMRVGLQFCMRAYGFARRVYAPAGVVSFLRRVCGRRLGLMSSCGVAGHVAGSSYPSHAMHAVPLICSGLSGMVLRAERDTRERGRATSREEC